MTAGRTTVDFAEAFGDVTIDDARDECRVRGWKAVLWA
jgi:hypothetical protein